VIRHVGIANYVYVAGPHNSDMATGVTADQRSALRAEIRARARLRLRREVG
jgi:hypothetical protein